MVDPAHVAAAMYEGDHAVRALGIETQIAHVITKENYRALPAFVRSLAEALPPEEGDEVQIFLQEMRIRFDEEGRRETAFRQMRSGGGVKPRPTASCEVLP